MPFEWSDFLTLAEDLANRGDEASLRSALSRAYYYVYHLALNRAERNQFKAQSGEGTHTQLWRLYRLNPDPDCKKLAEIAARIKEKRERADYNSSYARIDEDVPGMLADARDFAIRLARLPVRHPDPKSQRQ
jgi:uncharacterized protein (UPF0332 family)